MSEPDLDIATKEGNASLTTASEIEKSAPTTFEPEDEVKDDLDQFIGAEPNEKFGPVVVIRSVEEVEDIVRQRPDGESKEGFEQLRGPESAEDRETIVGTESKQRHGTIIDETKDKHGTIQDSKERPSAFNVQRKSQKSQILLSDIKIGSGLKVNSAVKVERSEADMADTQIADSKATSRTESKEPLGLTMSLKSQKSDNMMSDTKLSRTASRSEKSQHSSEAKQSILTSKSKSLPIISNKETGSDVKEPFKSNKSPGASKNFRSKSLKSQLTILRAKEGTSLFDKSQNMSDTKIDSRDLHSILMQRPSKSMSSENRFLVASAENSEITDQYHKPTPFSTRWVRGFNSKVPVINLNKDGGTILFYAAVNFGILYNWTTNSMKILEGHKHMVTNIAADATARWFVTADTGPENIITVWDAESCSPQKTIFSPHGANKLAKIALSADAKYLLSLAYTDKACLNFWIWSFGHDVPHASLQVDILPNGVMSMGFNPENSQQFLLMTKQEIWFGVSLKIFALEKGVLKETDDYELKIRCPSKKPSIDPGSFTCYTFVANTSQVLVATSRGAILVYGYNIEFQEIVSIQETEFENLRFVKVVKVEKHRINTINSIDGIIVMGNSCGEIRFYDEHLLLRYWVHGFRPDSIRGLSFNLSPRSYQILDPQCKTKCFCWEQVVVELDPVSGVAKQKLMKSKLPLDATIANRPFLVRDFVLNTHNQGIAFVDFATEQLQTIVDCKISPALSIDVHPEKPFLVIGYADGMVELFNFIQHHLFVRVDTRGHFTVEIPPKPDSTKCTSDFIIPEYSVTSLKYSPSGLHLACGMNTGEIIFLHPTTISILTANPHKDTKSAIQEINYSPDSKTLATADAERTVCVYTYDCSTLSWVFVGKHRAHYKNISTVFFTPEQNEDGNYKLISLGVDRIMVEYDLGQSSDQYLEILSLDRIEQAAVPLCGINWPNDTTLNPEEHRTDIPMLLFANDENKYKILNYQTTMTLSTILGPRYDTPVCRVKLVLGRYNGTTQQYLLFTTKTVIGMHKMPLDGNPWKHTGVMGHPIQITGWCFRDDIGTLFTIGAKDSCMVQWAAKFKSVDITTKQGGIDLDPYYCIIEDGRPGWLFQEIRDLFYYIQILCQGTFSPAIRHVKDFIPIASLPDLMRALGFFPTEYAVENLIVEAVYKVSQRQPSSEVDFEEFVKLYLNHRPAYGDSVVRVRNAFRNFARFKNDSYVMTREELLEMLSGYGECFSREQSWYLLSILSGLSFEDRASMQDDDFSFLPPTITYSDFLTQLLGIKEMELSDRYSVIESLCSGPTSSVSATSMTGPSLR